MIDHIDGLTGELEQQVIDMLNEDIDSTGYDHDEETHQVELGAQQAESQMINHYQEG